MTDGVAIVETPEGVRFRLPLAGPATRFVAWLVDALVISGACSITGQVLRLFHLLSADVAAALTVLAYFVISVGYAIALEWFWNGQTVGKRAVGLRVLDASGMKLQFSQVAIRNLMRFLDALPMLYFVGGAAVLATGKSQRLGDIVANTVVVRRKTIVIGDLANLGAGEKYNSLTQMPYLAARLRSQISPELAYLAYQALARHNGLESSARLQVFAELAARFRALTAFPEELTESLSDERYVRNALEVALIKNKARANSPGTSDTSKDRVQQIA